MKKWKPAGITFAPPKLPVLKISKTGNDGLGNFLFPVRAGKREKPEEMFQIEVVEWLEANFDGIFWHTPNENKLLNMLPAHRRIKLQKLLYDMGVRSGVLDLTLHWRCQETRQGRTLYIELKAKRGVMQQSQIDMRIRLMDVGIPSAVCRTLEEVKSVLLEHNAPMKVF